MLVTDVFSYPCIATTLQVVFQLNLIHSHTEGPMAQLTHGFSKTQVKFFPTAMVFFFVFSATLQACVAAATP